MSIDFMLNNNGSIQLYNSKNKNVIATIDSVAVKYKSNKVIKQKIESFFINDFEIKTKPKNCKVYSDINEKIFYIDNCISNDQNDSNLFLLTNPISYSFEENNIYKFFFEVKTFSEKKLHVNVNFSIFVYYYDNNKLIKRKKHLINLLNDCNYYIKNITLDIPKNTNKIAFGIFLNKKKLFLKNFYLEETIISTKMIKFSKWKIEDESYIWESKIEENFNINIILKKLNKYNELNIDYKLVPLDNITIYEINLNIIVNENIKKILYRDFKWENLEFDKVILDMLTPKILSFENFSIINISGIDSLEVNKKVNHTYLKINIVSLKDRPNFYFSETRDKVFSEDYKCFKNETKNFKIQLKFNSIDYPIIINRFPFGKEACFIMTHHADRTINESMKAILYGSSLNEDSFEKGLVNRNLNVTWSVFYKSIKKGEKYIVEGMDSEKFLNTMRKNKNHVEWILHTATHYDDNRQIISEALNAISEFNAKNWIDHSLASGTPSSGLKSRGWDKNSEYYVMDLFEEKHYICAWAYLDQPLENGINQLSNITIEEHVPIIFKHSDLRTESYELWQWITWRPPLKRLLEFVHYDSLINLIKEKGVSILHEYFAHLSQENYMFNIDSKGDFYITDEIDNMFKIIKKLVDKDLLWNPKMIDFVLYFEKLQNIFLHYNHKKVIIVNNNNSEVNGFTLYFPIKKGIKLNESKCKIILKKEDYNKEYLKVVLNLLPGENEIEFK